MNDIKDIIQLVAREAKKSGLGVFLVGGYLRDLVMGMPSTDLDFVVNKNVLKFVKQASKKLKSRVITLDEQNRIYRIVLKTEDRPLTLDFSAMYGKNINEDLSRRDFTINAFALAIESAFRPDLSRIIDPFKGLDDIKSKTIRSISEKNFIDDPLRLLRAYRFSAELKFDMSEKTQKQIKKHHRLVSKPASERVKEELIKILAVRDSSRYIFEMDRQKLLEPLFPGILEMKKSSRNFYFHPEGLWQHSKMALSGFERLIYPLAGAAEPVPNWPANLAPIPNIYSQDYGFDIELAEKISSHISSRLALIKFVTLFHDIAKPRTVARIKGRIRFFNHEYEGSKEIRKILQKLRFSNKEIQAAEKIVKAHMRPGNVAQNFHRGSLTPKAAYRFFRDMGDETIDILLLSLADRMSYIGISAKPKEIELHAIFVSKFSKRFFEYKQKTSQPKLIDGYQVMKQFKLPSGPVIGAILNFIREHQITGKVKTKEEALKLIRKNLPKLKKESSL